MARKKCSSFRSYWRPISSSACNSALASLGARVGISEQNASTQLRLLSSRGLITPQREGMKVIYRTEANAEVEYAQELLNVLREACAEKVPVSQVISSATAFTHPRRIQIVQALEGKGLRPIDIEERTGIQARSLQRHLTKLQRRGLVERTRGLYGLLFSGRKMGRCLLYLAISGGGERGDPCGRLIVAKVISGGQTGADRAALDAAITCGVPHGGWCPKGRRAEDGVLSVSYNLLEQDTDDYPSRTRANVEAADGTLIFSHGPLTGGSLLTRRCAEEMGRPCFHVDLLDDSLSTEDVAGFFSGFGSMILNVAGPRASGDPEVYNAVFRWMCDLLG